MRELRRVLRFAAIGAAATMLHLGLALTLVGRFDWPAQSANLAAFAPALLLSFLGHFHFSFESTLTYRKTLPRFIGVAVTGYAASAFVISALGPALGPHKEALILVASMTIPIASYLANRFFVFS